MLDQLSHAGLRVTPRVTMKKPEVRGKTNIICEWIGKTVCPLKKFGIVFDNLGPQQWDFRPTLFTIQNSNITHCKITCDAQNVAAYLNDPIRFDIENCLRSKVNKGVY